MAVIVSKKHYGDRRNQQRFSETVPAHAHSQKLLVNVVAVYWSLALFATEFQHNVNKYIRRAIAWNSLE